MEVADTVTGVYERVAVVSDVHGNSVAFDAVLSEALREPTDVLLNLGCLTYGPRPSAVAATLAGLPIPVLSVRGNGDRAVLELVAGTRAPQTDRDRFAIDHHDEAALAVLGGTEPVFEIEVPGLGTIVCCHGSPRSDVELITPATSTPRLRDALGGRSCAVLATGHTHLQFDRRLGFVRSVGPGSVGLPYHDGPPGARWAMLGPDVELRTSGYDLDAAIADAAGYPEVERWARMLTAPPTLAEIVADAEARLFSD